MEKPIPAPRAPIIFTESGEPLVCIWVQLPSGSRVRFSQDELAAAAAKKISREVMVGPLKTVLGALRLKW